MDPRRYMFQRGWDNNSALKGYGAVHEPEFRGGGSYSRRRFHDEPYSRDPIYARGVFPREVLERNSCPPPPSVGTWHQPAGKFFDEEYAIARESRHHEKPYLESYHDIDGFHGDEKYREMDTFHAFDKFRDSYRPIENYRDIDGYHGHGRHAKFKGRDRDGILVDDYEYRHHGLRHQWAVNSPSHLSERAKIVLNSSSEPQTPVMQSAYKDSPARVNIHHQEQRPSMSNKRARFSLRPCTSQSSVLGGMSLNIDKLQDPEEYFLAFEKHERVEEEAWKQRHDVPTNLTKHRPTTTPHSRRRGISGRKARHGRRSSSLVANLDETIGPSGKGPEMDPPSQSNKTPNLAITDEHGASQEKKLAHNGFMGATQGSVAKEMNKGGLSDELILQGGTNLDGDGAVKFQERSPIKPFNLEKLFLSKVDEDHRNDGEVSLKQLPRQKKALPEVDNAAERAKGKEFLETQQLAESSNISPDSPTPLRSPFSSRHLSDGVRPGIPFLPPGIEDDSPVKDSTHDEGISKVALLLHADSDYEPVEMEVNRNGPNFTFVSMTPEKPPVDTAESAHSIDLKDGKVGGMQPEALVEGRDDPVETYMDVDNLVNNDSAHLLNPVLDNLHKSSKVMDLTSNGLLNGFEDTQQMETVGSNQAEPSCEGLSIENLHYSGSSQAGALGSTVNEDHAKRQSQITDTLGENNQESPRESPNVLNKQKGSPRSGRKGPLVRRKSRAGELLNVGNKQKSRETRRRSCPNRLEGELLNVENEQKSRATRRRSCPNTLEGAGTQWQGGQRKSTRMRVRPLEFWRGERFLYGRVEESLPTVIACKFASPGEGDPKRIS